MRILHVSPSYLPATKYGGPLVSVHTLNTFLVKQGHTVDVVTTTAGIDVHQGIHSGFTQVLNGVSVIYFDYWGYEHFNFSWALYCYLQKAVYRYDVVHITAVWNFPVWAAAQACIKAKKTYIISPRGTLYPETIRLGGSLLKKAYLSYIAKDLLIQASAIHCTSDDEALGFQKLVPNSKKVFVISNGIDISYWYTIPSVSFRNAFPELKNRPYLLFLGRIHYKKGLDLLWEVAKDFFSAYPEAMWVMAGHENDAFGKQLREIATFHGFDKHIIWTGPLKQPLLKAAYTEARWFILPSYSENFAMTVIESLLSGCPTLVSTKVALAPLVMRYGAGWEFEPNPTSLKEVLFKLWPQTDLRDQMSEAGHELVGQHFEADLVARLTATMYETLISEENKKK